MTAPLTRGEAEKVFAAMAAKGDEIAFDNLAEGCECRAQLMIEHMGKDLEQQYEQEKHFTTHVVRGAKAEDAFPEFIARHGRRLNNWD